MANVVVLTDGNFENKISSGKWIVDFYADWCGPCKAQAPVIEELSGDYSGKINFGKLNIDENVLTTEKFGVMGIPTLKFFKDGAEMDSLTGLRSKESLAGKIKEIFKI